MDKRISRRSVVRATVVGGAAWPLIELLKGTRDAVAGGGNKSIAVTQADEQAFARKLRVFAADLSPTEWLLLRLTTDPHNFHPDRDSRPPQSQSEDFAGDHKACTCTVELTDDGWVMHYDANCPVHGGLV